VGGRRQIPGSDGEFSCIQIADNLQICEAWFSKETICGIEFPHVPPLIAYCPSACEEEPITFCPDHLKPDVVHLPLTNGLLSLDENLYLVRDNCAGIVAARIQKGENRCLRFVVEGSALRKRYRWRLFLFRGGLLDAVRLANAVNTV